MKEKSNNREIIIIGMIILFEYLLFRSYIIREVMWAYPQNYDQSGIIKDTYILYDHIVQRNYMKIFGYIQERHTGVLLHFLGAISLLLLGDTRISLYTVNFIMLAILQIFGYYKMKKLTGKRIYGILYFSLVLMVPTTFNIVGGINDFRLDYAAMCLYMCAFCVLIQAKKWNSKTALRGAIGFGVLVWLRFITVTYIIGAIGLYILCFIIKKWKEKVNWSEISGFIRCCLCFLLFPCIFVLFTYKGIYGYYVVGHLTGNEKEFRAVEQGVYSLADNIMFYPKSLINTHLSLPLKIIFIIIIFFVFIFAIQNRKQKITVDINIGSQYGKLLLCGCGIIAPFIILIMDQSKSPLVISIVVPLLCFSLVFVLSTIFDFEKYRKSLYTLTIISLVGGTLFFIINITGQQKNYSENRKVIESKVDLDEKIVKYIFDNELENRLCYFTDRISGFSDGVNSIILQIYAHELYNHTINCIETHGENGVVTEYNEEDITEFLSNSNIIVFGEDLPDYYPSEISMNKYHKKIVDYANTNMELIATEKINNKLVYAYGRKSPICEGKYADWFSTEDNFITIKKYNDDNKYIKLENMQGMSYENLKATCLEAGTEEEIPVVVVETEKGIYNISIDISNLSQGEHTVDLLFDNYFIPSQVSTSSDDRKLVLLYPENVIVTNN